MPNAPKYEQRPRLASGSPATRSSQCELEESEVGGQRVKRDSLSPPVGRRRRCPDTMAPDGSEIRLLLGTAQAAERASLCEVTLDARQRSRPVWHRSVEELWYVLRGTGSVWRSPPDSDPARTMPVDVGPGEALVIPPGWYFQFAAGPRPLTFLCFTCPPWPGADEAQSAPSGGLGRPTV